MNFEGIYTPAITPHREDGSIDRDAFVAQLEYLIAQGVHGIVNGGSTGEYYAQPMQERLEMASRAREVTKGRCRQPRNHRGGCRRIRSDPARRHRSPAPRRPVPLRRRAAVPGRRHRACPAGAGPERLRRDRPGRRAVRRRSCPCAAGGLAEWSAAPENRPRRHRSGRHRPGRHRSGRGSRDPLSALAERRREWRRRRRRGE